MAVQPNPLAATIPATSPVSITVTPSPMPTSVLARRQSSILNTYVGIAILIAVLGVLLWAGFRRGRSRNGVSILEAVAGFLGWFVVNTYLWIWVTSDEPGTIFFNPFRLVPMCVTIPALLVLGFTRRWIALGMLAAILVNAIGTLLFGVIGPYEDDRFMDILGMLPFFLPHFLPGL